VVNSRYARILRQICAVAGEADKRSSLLQDLIARDLPLREQLKEEARSLKDIVLTEVSSLYSNLSLDL
jgi:hypothetical protein